MKSRAILERKTKSINKYTLTTENLSASKRELEMRKTSYSRLWYKPDTKFFKPKAYVKMDFNCPLAVSSPVAVAGLHYRLSLSDNGFELSLVGFNQKLRILLEAVIQKIANFEVKPERFSVIKKLVSGNVEKDEAESMVKHIEDVLFNDPKPICRPLFPSELLTSRVAELGTGMKYFYHQEGSDPSDENSALVHYIQVHQDEFSMNIKLQLFKLIAKQATFHQHRTVEQLGYIASLSQRNNSGVYGLQLFIQSSVKGPGHIDSRVESLLNDLESKLY
ncbi:unnamed protein product [Arabidopsis thaliana]|uniref:Peptidase M16 middle/third domain-containing protein n=1 Tax=Arabidopsis thaliana TaxID=3702 RepID=A0A654FIM9_ARATH|nr:unnamed protein product [Arabidopsis thaliana]